MRINPGQEKGAEREASEEGNGAGPTEYTAGPSSCVRGEESHPQVPKY